MNYENIYIKELCINDKKAILIGYWIDLVAYYWELENDRVWQYHRCLNSLVCLSNNYENFKQDFLNNKYRGILI